MVLPWSLILLLILRLGDFFTHSWRRFLKRVHLILVYLDNMADADRLCSPESINHSIGLCNGARLMVTRLCEWVLEARIMTGSDIGDRVCIPRFVLNAPSTKWSFTLQRWQYPLPVCYAMSINKRRAPWWPAPPDHRALLSPCASKVLTLAVYNFPLSLFNSKLNYGFWTWTWLLYFTKGWFARAIY